MSRLVRWVCALALVFVVSGCSPQPTPTPPEITMTATPTTLPGDGKSESIIGVSRPGEMDVTLRVNRGTFKESGKGTYLLAGGTGTATFVACDSVLIPRCAGVVPIKATSDDEAAGQVDATVQQLEICNDGVDNDKNSKVDCADTVCLNKACSSADAGVRLCDETGVCACSTGTDEDCTNFKDDNCDGKVDCADSMCDQRACNVNPGVGGHCSANVCTCTPGAENCSNGFDDDCDGKIDCADTDCKATTSALGKVCDAVKGLTCSVPDNTGKSACTVCPGGSGPEVLCADGKDSDCDGLVDCLDSDCATKACKSAFSTSAAGNGWSCNLASVPTDKCECSGNGGASQMVETTCDDGFDNDCDGTIDCADTDCLAAGGQVCGPFGKKCLALNSCACGAPVENCRTPQDDNCNGLVNCEETSCRPGGSSLGAACDESGNTCSQVIGGVSLCNTCTVDGGIVETAEGSTGGASITCGDRKDNDCDSTAASPSTDCQDPDCSGKPCSLTGGICNYAIKKCACLGGLSNEQNLCNDGIDNDCDGQIDCADADCQPGPSLPASVCGSGNGRLCAAGGTCACSGNGGTAEATEGALGPSTCGDGVDNDCDGVIDCLDTDCRATTAGAFGKDCSRAPLFATKCDVSGVCVCPGGQATEAICGDSLDNDCDGKIDCSDPDCANQLCPGGNGKKCIGSPLACACPGGQIGETTCNDGLDNDCDGLVDCADPNCQGNPGQLCNVANANYRCIPSGGSFVCGDDSALFSVSVKSTPVVSPSSSTPNRIPADGVNTSTITATLKDNLGGLANGAIEFSVTGGGTVSPTSVLTSSGVATTTYTAPTTQGAGVIAATHNTVSGTTSIDLPRLGQIKFLTQQYSVMGVRSSSFQETNQLTFQLLDTSGQPYPPGLTVHFTHQQFGGSYIGSTTVCSGSPVICTATGVTDNSGFVSVLLHSGTIASVVSVTADATAGGASASVSASNIAIVGAKANSLHMSLDCTPKNVPALTNTDCVHSFLQATITCRVAFADRFNNVLGVATLATFTSEAGAAGTPTTTPVYSPGNPNLGTASGFVSVGGHALPVDVTPFADEYWEVYDSRCGDGLKTHNPRDGLVTIIVSANGEEGFVDGSNGHPLDGQYNSGEFLMDQGEPFVDANDNGIHDDNEAFVDGNSNRVYDGPNGEWDANTVVWAETRVMYTGYAQLYTSTPPDMNHVSRLFDLLVSPAPPYPTPPVDFHGWSMSQAHSQNFGLRLADANFNYPAQSTAYSLTVVNRTNQSVSASFNPPPPAPEDKLGLTFSQQFCNTGASVCGSACNSSPCYLVGSVGGYSYGFQATVNVSYTVPAPPVPIPSVEVRANSTYNGINVPVSVMGSVQ